jgi:hypothetical protein
MRLAYALALVAKIVCSSAGCSLFLDLSDNPASQQAELDGAPVDSGADAKPSQDQDAREGLDASSLCGPNDLLCETFDEPPREPRWAAERQGRALLGYGKDPDGNGYLTADLTSSDSGHDRLSARLNTTGIAREELSFHLWFSPATDRTSARILSLSTPQDHACLCDAGCAGRPSVEWNVFVDSEGEVSVNRSGAGDLRCQITPQSVNFIGLPRSQWLPIQIKFATGEVTVAAVTKVLAPIRSKPFDSNASLRIGIVAVEPMQGDGMNVRIDNLVFR